MIAIESITKAKQTMDFVCCDLSDLACATADIDPLLRYIAIDILESARNVLSQLCDLEAALEDRTCASS